MPEKKANLSTILSWLIVVVLLVILLFLGATVYQALMSTTKIVHDSAYCSEATCIEFNARYSDGQVVWKPVSWLPLSFLVTVSGYEEGQELNITCPLPAENSNEFLARIQFLTSQTKLNQCQFSTTE